MKKKSDESPAMSHVRSPSDDEPKPDIDSADEFADPLEFPEPEPDVDATNNSFKLQFHLSV
jgi:hypothetical protein